MFNSRNSLNDNPIEMSALAVNVNLRIVPVWLAAIFFLVWAMPARSATVYSQMGASLSSAKAISSYAVANPEGSDGDVTAYDNFAIGKSASITGVSWRGSSSNDGSAGFTIRIYASNPNPAAQPDISAPLGEINVAGKSGEVAVGKNLSEYRAEFIQPLALTSGVQYWISIVSSRKDFSAWGWADGEGGDGKSIQSYSEFRILSAPNDRAFALHDGTN